MGSAHTGPSYLLKQFVDYKIMADEQALANGGSDFSNLYEFFDQAHEEGLAPKLFMDMKISSNVILIFRCGVGCYMWVKLIFN